MDDSVVAVLSLRLQRGGNSARQAAALAVVAVAATVFSEHERPSVGMGLLNLKPMAADVQGRASPPTDMPDVQSIAAEGKSELSGMRLAANTLQYSPYRA
ncbi:hypothetical protein HPB50_013224 [Hyalomma asiaticum]|uniref:Uncharacterized protein n=1 Tax=Hyalomma asiaticum TaxID=266040 RepID=A0ACB7THH2_HYAAI|nr:hypothetical protein HPB50_013224 [Hyalomma asiaticum]